MTLTSAVQLKLAHACYRSKSGSLAEYNIHELVTGKASQAQKQLLHESYARAGSLEQRLAYLKASLMKEYVLCNELHSFATASRIGICLTESVHIIVDCR